MHELRDRLDEVDVLEFLEFFFQCSLVLDNLFVILKGYEVHLVGHVGVIPCQYQLYQHLVGLQCLELQWVVHLQELVNEFLV